MNKNDFVKQLRLTSEELKPLTHSAMSCAAIWDGQSYVKGEVKEPDPYALAWSAILDTIAGLIEAQESQLSPKQITYLTRVLFGGMGSLNDLCFDPKSLGDAARVVNERLDQRRQVLFASFKT